MLNHLFQKLENKITKHWAKLGVGGLHSTCAFMTYSSGEGGLAESSSAETSISSNFSGSSHSTNFSAYTSEVESDSEANSSEAGLSSQVSLCWIV